MWKLYGEHGVAVFSTASKIRKALEVSGANQGIISPVTYVPLPSRARPRDVWEQFGLMRRENLPRPYLYKDSGFRIEEEVRFVLAANPIVTDNFGGAMINIAAQSIARVRQSYGCEKRQYSRDAFKSSLPKFLTNLIVPAFLL
jgi:hypothetical protein